MKAQAVAMGQDAMGSAASTAVLEINAEHGAIRKLAALVEASPDAEETRDFAKLIYEVAAVTSGYEIKDPAAFAKRITYLMTPEGVAPGASTEATEAPQADAAEEVDVEVVSDGESGGEA